MLFALLVLGAVFAFVLHRAFPNLGGIKGGAIVFTVVFLGLVLLIYAGAP
ncbi:hypothetical protein PMI07_000807 [Rhizobium sp. CF080]|nr:hypothetical protein [Rhizobium sp. CF080]EUB97231.1 hypothetical protein PMI07_000807 [Rhizobium sp. CF080]